MERRAVGTTADSAVEELANQWHAAYAFEFQNVAVVRFVTAFPKRYFPAIPIGHVAKGCRAIFQSQ